MTLCSSEHQSPEVLQRGLVDIRNRGGHARLEGLCDATVPLSCSEAKRQAADLCHLLLDYASFTGSLARVDKVNPFDDPFVGAALMTENCNLIAAHRKVTPNECHAEAATLFGALEKVDTDDSRNLAASIIKAYKNKSWLQGPREEKTLVANFSAAGDLVREWAKQQFPESKYLVLVVTLEPCGEFESQPACAHLIYGFRPDLVVYASDDTNPKGHGRSFLVSKGLPVVPNAAVERNLEVNGIFYAAVHCLEQLHQTALDSPGRNLEIFYATIQLDVVRPSFSFEKERLRIRHEPETPVYQAPLSPRAGKSGPSLPRSLKVDPERVLFIDTLHAGFLEGLCRRHSDLTTKVPGVIICPQSPRTKSEGELVNRLRNRGVRVYTNAFRRADDRFLALHHIRMWKDPLDPGSRLFAVAKLQEDYATISGTPATVAKRLQSLKDVRRVSLSVDHASVNVLEALVTDLHNHDAFVPGGQLCQVSFQVSVVAEKPPDAKGGVERVTEFIQDKGLDRRFLISSVVQPTLTPQRLHRQTLSGRLDPIMVSPEQLGVILPSISWRERRDVGLFLGAAVRRHPGLYRTRLVDPIPANFRPKDWAKTCSLLNALVKHGRPHKDTDINPTVTKLTTLAKSLESILGSGPPPPTLPDVICRLCAAVFAVCPEKAVGILSGNRLRQSLSTDSFLLRELFFFATRALHETPSSGALELPATLVEQLVASGSPIHNSVLIRIARLSQFWSGGVGDGVTKALETIPTAARSILNDELERCAFVMQRKLSGVFADPARCYALFPTYLYLQTTHAAPYGLVQAVSREVTHTLDSRLRTGEGLLSWRGDKTVAARIALAEVPATEVFGYLQAMAFDEDEAIRWAAMILAMDVDMRLRYLEARGGSAAADLRGLVQGTLNTSLGGGPSGGTPHYWLHRECLELLRLEYASEGEAAGPILPAEVRLNLADVPAVASLPRASREEQHPEVQEALDRLCAAASALSSKSDSSWEVFCK
jgi:pyrimidine deaminase RibD-like protein